MSKTGISSPYIQSVDNKIRKMIPLTPETPNSRAVSVSLVKLGNMPGALLPVLHDIQDTLGYIPPECVDQIGQALNLSRAEVHGVITFYPHFHTTPKGAVHIEVCRAESCQAMGSAQLEAHIREATGCDMNSTRADGQVSVDAVYCLGLCAQSPNIMINGEPCAHVTPQTFDELYREHTEAVSV